jgi:hypothetical protein
MILWYVMPFLLTSMPFIMILMLFIFQVESPLFCGLLEKADENGLFDHIKV